MHAIEVGARQIALSIFIRARSLVPEALGNQQAAAVDTSLQITDPTILKSSLSTEYPSFLNRALGHRHPSRSSSQRPNGAQPRHQDDALRFCRGQRQQSQ